MKTNTAARLPESETVLYGRKLDSEEWQEELLTTNPARIEEVKRLAGDAGYGHFRVATIDLSTPPDFRRTIR
jgi:hypothetical protein